MNIKQLKTFINTIHHSLETIKNYINQTYMHTFCASHLLLNKALNKIMYRYKSIIKLIKIIKIYKIDKRIINDYLKI